MQQPGNPARDNEPVSSGDAEDAGSVVLGVPVLVTRALTAAREYAEPYGDVVRRILAHLAENGHALEADRTPLPEGEDTPPCPA